jgi:hypothetical protein
MINKDPKNHKRKLMYQLVAEEKAPYSECFEKEKLY